MNEIIETKGTVLPILKTRKKLSVVELFAGIGSYAEALRRNGVEHEIKGISEINKYAIAAHKLLHGDIPNYGDIAKVEKLPKTDMWCYSAPCTDISLAGQMRGMARDSNTASSLLWEVERLLYRAKDDDELPKYLIMENVPMLVSKKFIHSFNEWLEVLEKLGYKNFWKVLNAKDYGVPQNRERVFMISIRDENASYEFPEKQELKLKLFDMLEPEVDNKYFLSEKLITYFSDMKNRNGFIRGLRFRPHDEKSKYAYTISTHPAGRATDNFISETVCLNSKVNGKQPSLQNRIYDSNGIATAVTTSFHPFIAIPTAVNDLGVIVEKDKALMIRKITPRESLRLMGWTDERIELIINSFSDARLYTFAGNGIVIDVLCEIFKELFKNEDL